jgi:hypothetical protein
MPLRAIAGIAAPPAQSMAHLFRGVARRIVGYRICRKML